MALPRESDSYEEYTDQLVYFASRLAANPVTAPLAAEVEALLAELDGDQIALRDARREEIRQRARRDHQDDIGDEQTRRYYRRIGAVVDKQHYVVGRLFPRGVGHVMAPRGRAQLERLSALIQATDEALQAPQVTNDPDAAELTDILQTGRLGLQQAVAALTLRVDAWEAQTLAVSRAQDVFNYRRSEGIARMGVVVGELRAVLGGSARAAYAYTQPARSRNATDDGDDDSEDAPPDNGDDGGGAGAGAPA